MRFSLFRKKNSKNLFFCVIKFGFVAVTDRLCGSSAQRETVQRSDSSHWSKQKGNNRSYVRHRATPISPLPSSLFLSRKQEVEVHTQTHLICCKFPISFWHFDTWQIFSIVTHPFRSQAHCNELMMHQISPAIIENQFTQQWRKSVLVNTYTKPKCISIGACCK